ncbi:29877_t:CDS:1, partial [Gigaspora margarita]
MVIATCGLREGDTYRLNYHNLEKQSYSGLQLRFRLEKNNQRGVLYQQCYSHT